MPSTEELIVRIGADFDELKRGLKGATQETENFGDEVKKTGKTVKFQFEGMATFAKGLAAGVAAATVAIGAMTKNVMENAREQRLWARRLGVSTENFSALTAVAKRFGAETDDVGDAMKDLNERIADAARGNKTYEEALRMVGLASRDLIHIPVEEQFIKVADAIGKMNNVGDQNFATAELMADAGFRLLDMFRKGETGIRRMADEVVRTNEAMSAFELKQLEDAGKASKELSAAFTAFSNELTQAALPAIKTMTMLLKDAAEFYGKLFEKSSEDIKADIEDINEKIARLGDPGGRPSRGRALTVWLDKNRRINALLNERAKLIQNLSAIEGKSVTVGGISATPEPEQKESVPFIGEVSDEKREEIKVKRQEDLNSMVLDAMNAEMSLLDIKRRSEEEITKVQEDNTNARIRLREKERMAALGVTKGMLGNLATLMSSGNKKAFQIGKAAAIAQATISTYESATTSFAQGSKIGGPPLGAAFAATAVAAGLANIANIASTTMGGGGGGASSAVGGVGGVGAEPPPPPENVIDATFNVQGEVFGADAIRGLASGLNEYLEDGGRLRSVTVQ